MKTTYQILQETIQISRKLGNLDVKECEIDKRLISEAVQRDGASTEEQLDVQWANFRLEKERINEKHELAMEMLNCSERLNAFLWLFEDDMGE